MSRVSHGVRGLICLLGLSGGGAHAAEPLSFKGLALGGPATSILQDARFDCRNVNTPVADMVCTLRPKQHETLAGAPLESLYYFFDRARLTSVVAGFADSYFNTVSHALEQKYGTTPVTVEPIKTVSGKVFQNQTYAWQQNSHQLMVQRYAGQVNRSILRLTDTTAAARIQQRKAAPPAADL